MSPIDRRDALRGIAGLAALGLLPSGCSDDAAPPRLDLSLDAPVAQTRWLELYGHLCLLHLPASVIATRPDRAPLLLAFHDLGESPPVSVDRWSAASDGAGFALLCPNWTAESDERRLELLDHLIRIVEALDRTQPIDPDRVCLSALGGATPFGFHGAFERHSGRWAAVSFLGGVPEGDWVAAPATALAALTEKPPALHYIYGATDPEHEAAKACASALAGRAVKVEASELPGSVASASFDAAKVWSWLGEQRAKSS